MSTVAYWISPKGEIFDVKTKHIKAVITNPEKFGFTEGFIEYIYDFYNEKVGQEGKAREQLMKALFKEGWIRIRKYGDNFWSINVKKFAGKAKTYLTKWAQKVLKGLFGFKEQDPYIPVKIDQENKPIKSIELQKIADSDKFISENVLIETKLRYLSNLTLLTEYMRNFGYKISFKEYLNS